VPPGLPTHAEAVAAAKAQKAPTAAAAAAPHKQQQQLRSPQRAATPNGPSSAAAAARASSSSSSASAAAVQRDYFAAADAAQYAQEVGGGAEGEALLDDELRQLRLRLRTAKRQGAPLAKRRQEVRCACYLLACLLAFSISDECSVDCVHAATAL
jgi:hypothetical protein